MAKLSAVVETKVLDAVKGIGLSQERVMKDGSADETVLASACLHALYIADDATKLGVAKISIGDGLITTAMKGTYKDLKTEKTPTVYDPAYLAAYGAAKAEDELDATADGMGRAAGNEALIKAGVVRLDPQNAWKVLVEQVEGGITADELVSLLAQVGPDGQKWGERILLDAYRADVK